MENDLKDSTLDSLFGKLHGLMVNLVKDVDSVLEDNKEVSMDGIRTLRDHINYKLGKKEEIQDNERLLKVLNLFSEDKAVIEIIREDSEEWVKLLDAIEDGLEKGGAMTSREQNEIKQIRRLTGEIKQLIRK